MASVLHVLKTWKPHSNKGILLEYQYTPFSHTLSPTPTLAKRMNKKKHDPLPRPKASNLKAPGLTSRRPPGHFQKGIFLQYIIPGKLEDSTVEASFQPSPPLQPPPPNPLPSLYFDRLPSCQLAPNLRDISRNLQEFLTILKHLSRKPCGLFVRSGQDLNS